MLQEVERATESLQSKMKSWLELEDWSPVLEIHYVHRKNGDQT